jgi:hypothetical protein
MFFSSVEDWYTDLATINRVQTVMDGNITKSQRMTIAENVPCRVYRSSSPQTSMQPTAAQVNPTDMLACDNSVDIIAGDEVMVIRGGNIGYPNAPQRYFAGEPSKYYEPVGGVMPDLAHQQVPLGGEKRN